MNSGSEVAFVSDFSSHDNTNPNPMGQNRKKKIILVQKNNIDLYYLGFFLLFFLKI